MFFFSYRFVGTFSRKSVCKDSKSFFNLTQLFHVKKLLYSKALPYEKTLTFDKVFKIKKDVVCNCLKFKIKRNFNVFSLKIYRYNFSKIFLSISSTSNNKISNYWAAVLLFVRFRLFPRMIVVFPVKQINFSYNRNYVLQQFF